MTKLLINDKITKYFVINVEEYILKITNKLYLISIILLLVIPFAVAGIVVPLVLGNPVFIIMGIVLVFAATVAWVALYNNICKYHAQMPLNSLSDYEIRFPHFADLGKTDEKGILCVEICEIERGIWLIDSGTIELIFDLGNYLSPIGWLRAYFVRQAAFYEINAKRYTVEKLFVNCKLTTLRDFKSMKMIFVRKSGKKIIKWIIRNKRCRNSNWLKQINNAIIKGKFDRQRYKNTKVVFKKVDESFVADNLTDKNSIKSAYINKKSAL